MLAIAALLAGCDSSESDIVLTAATQCHYEGPVEIAAGEHDVVVFGEAEVDFYLIDVAASYQSIIDHYRAEDPAHHPPGATRMFGVANQPGLHEDRSAQDGTSRTLDFAPGSYAVVCEWSSGDASGRRAVSLLEVSG